MAYLSSKSVNMKILTKLIAESWGEIKKSTLHEPWGKIMPIQEPKESEDQTEGHEDLYTNLRS